MLMGLRYEVREAGRTPPPIPSVFIKPNTSIVGHDDLVIVPKIAQDEQADYEGELVSTNLTGTAIPFENCPLLLTYGGSASVSFVTQRTFPKRMP